MKLRYFLIIFTFLLLLLLFLFRITYFSFPTYDEPYYVEAAQSIYLKGVDINEEHPPLAKWLISLPMHVFGPSWSLSWRLMPLVFGFLGLIVMYIFARILDLNWWQSLLVVLMLVASKSWYILSRTAMLDIFVAVFLLISGVFLWLFLSKNNFGDEIARYTYRHYFVGFCLFIALAAASKWNGFFPFIFFVVQFIWFYARDSLKRKIYYLGMSSLFVFGFYSLVYISLLQFNLVEFAERHGFSFLTHYSGTLPENNPPNHFAKGGWEAVLHYFVYDQAYRMHFLNYDDAEFSNHHLIAVGFLVFTLVSLLVFVGAIIRKIQKIPFEFPGWLLDRRVGFLYVYACTIILPWILLPRRQYIHYYVPAFPFILLLIAIVLFKYSKRWVWIVALLVYFGYFALRARYMIPL